MTTRKGHLRKLSRSFGSEMEIESETPPLSKSKENNKNDANKTRISLNKGQTEEEKTLEEDFQLKSSKKKNKHLVLDEDDNFPLSFGEGGKEEVFIKQKANQLSPPSVKESLESKDTAASEVLFEDLDARYKEERSSRNHVGNTELKNALDGRMEIETKVAQGKKTEVVQNHTDCSICLSQISDIVAKLNSCTHTFCFDCIKDWSKVANECPLCKNRFTKITKWSKEGAKLGEARIKFKAQVSEEPEYEIIENTDEACYECGSAEDMQKMLVCEECMFYCCHIYCCRPPMTRIPIDPWYCLFCRPDQRLVRQREREEESKRNSGPRRADSVVSRSIRNSLPEDSVLARLFETADREIQTREFGRSSSRKKKEETPPRRRKREVSSSRQKRRKSSEDESEKSESEEKERKPRRKSTSRKSTVRKSKKNLDERSRSRTKSKNKTTRKKKTVKSSRSPKRTQKLKPTSSKKKKVVKTVKK